MASRVIGRFSGLDTTVIPGMRVSRCPLCDELFSGEKTYAFHRLNDRTPPGRPAVRLLGSCQDPASKGMMLRNGVWEWCVRTLGGDEGPETASAESFVLEGV